METTDRRRKAGVHRQVKPRLGLRLDMGGFLQTGFDLRDYEWRIVYEDRLRKPILRGRSLRIS